MSESLAGEDASLAGLVETHADNAAAVAAWRRRRRARSGIDFIAALGIEHRTFRLPSGRERFQQRHPIRSAEPRAGIPSFFRLVYAVVALHDVAEPLSRIERVELRMHESQPVTLGLIEQRDQARPQRRHCAGAAEDRRLSID